MMGEVWGDGQGTRVTGENKVGGKKSREDGTRHFPETLCYFVLPLVRYGADLNSHQVSEIFSGRIITSVYNKYVFAVSLHKVTS